jgi:hypothetical protein
LRMLAYGGSVAWCGLVVGTTLTSRADGKTVRATVLLGVPVCCQVIGVDAADAGGEVPAGR